LHVIAALEGGGAERQLQILVNNTDPERYHVSIIFFHRGTGQYLFNEEIELLQIPRGRKWNIIPLWLRIYKAVKAYQPDILQLWVPEIITIPAAFAGRLSGAYIMSSARGSRRSVNSIKRRIRHLASYITHIMADRIIANFNPDSEPWFFRKLFMWKRGCIIRNAIVVNQSKIVKSPFFLIPKGTSFMIWYVGRIIPSKRLDILLDSFAELIEEGLNISLIICGTGEDRLLRKLKKQVRINALDEHVIFPGYRDDWHSLAQDADLFVLPSTAEGMPNVLFEAMLLGIPCIATDIPVLSDILSHKINLWMVKAGSRISLISGIKEMYQSPTLRKQLAQAGQLYARNFSVEKMMRAYEALYNNCNKTSTKQSQLTTEH